jgi:hypothetical protein
MRELVEKGRNLSNWELALVEFSLIMSNMEQEL